MSVNLEDSAAGVSDIILTDDSILTNSSEQKESNIESSDFYLPEDQLEVDIVPRGRRLPVLESSSSPRPPYLRTCYDEFSREFITFSIAPQATTTIQTIPYNAEFAKSLNFLQDPFSKNSSLANAVPTKAISLQMNSRILHHFDPGYYYWPSSFRTIPPDTSHLLDRIPSTDTNLFVKFVQYNVKEHFEPLFGTMAIYTMVNDVCTKISENFNFDMTAQNIRVKFKEAYRIFMEDQESNDSKKGVAHKVDMATQLKAFLFNLPADMRNLDIFLVVQVSKVLSGDFDKAVGPYIRSAYTNYSIDSKLEETCKRLHLYRQQIAIGCTRIFDEQKRVGQPGSPVIKFFLYGIKSCVNDAFIGQV
jgi:hypothetical protein